MVGRATEASWLRKIEILKAACDPEMSLQEIASRFNVSKGTAWNTIHEFTTTYQLTEDESDFPRKLLKLYNVNIPKEGGGDPLNQSDVRNLRHLVEKARKREVGDDEVDALPTDFSNDPSNVYRSQQIGMSGYGIPDPNASKNFDKTTEDGLWRSILYSAKNVNPQANERFINLYNMGKKGFQANPQALLDLMRHMFGPGFGTDAFNLFHSSKGEFIADTAGQPVNVGGGGMDPLMMMMMMGGGGDMTQLLPLMMQNGGLGGVGGVGGGGQMSQAMQMMMMSQLQKQAEKKEKQEQWDQMMNVMMLKMIGGTMDSRTQMDAASGNFMVNEILDKNNNVTKRELVPMATILSNPLMASGIFNRSGSDETTQAVLRNALEEKSKAFEMVMQQNQPMTQILMTLLSNYQQRNDPIAQFSQLMDMKDKFMGGSGEVNPEIERMKIDLQLALSQQNMTLEQMKHNWDMEREEKKAGAENVKSWMSMIGQVGEKLAAPAMQIVAGGMGKGAGLLNQQQPGPGGLPPLGSQPVKPGGLSTPPPPPPRPQAQVQQMGPTLGVPDPDHNAHLFPEQPQEQQQRQGIDPQMVMIMSKMEQLERTNMAYQQEINRLRQLYIQESNQTKDKPQPEPVVDKNQLAKMSDDQIKEILENLKDNEQDVERTRQILEAELSDREWLSAPPPEVDDYDRKEANRIAKEDNEEPKQVESLEEEHVDLEEEELPPEPESVPAEEEPAANA